MWPSRPPAAASTRSASRATTSKGARSTAGSRLPWIPLPGPIRRQASSSGTRQSTLTRSLPAPAIDSSSPTVPVPKWMVGTPVARTASKMRRL